MIHTFLLEPTQWTLNGFWCERNLPPLAVQGKINISWYQPNWFTWVTKLILPQPEELPTKNRFFASTELLLNYQGYLGEQQNQYTFVLKHNCLGNLEGSGWITPNSITQRYWVLNDRKRRQGFETLDQQTENVYRLCSCFTQGHQMMIALEATLTREFSSN